MASGTFKVSLDSLEDLADRMDHVSDHFHQVAEKRYSYSGFSDADPMEHGLSEFFGKWTDGLDMIHHKIDGVAKRLHGAVDAYCDTEEQIVQAASGKG